MYVSLNIETTGIDPDTCDVLSLAAVLDTGEGTVDDLPFIHMRLLHEKVQGDVETFSWESHRALLKDIHEGERTPAEYPIDAQWDGNVRPTSMVKTFHWWLAEHHPEWDSSGLVPQMTPITLAGKNVRGFDVSFLDAHFGFSEATPIHHRAIDLGSVYWTPEGGVPSTKECAERAGLDYEYRHDALYNARFVVRALRAYTS